MALARTDKLDLDESFRRSSASAGSQWPPLSSELDEQSHRVLVEILALCFQNINSFFPVQPFHEKMEKELGMLEHFSSI